MKQIYYHHNLKTWQKTTGKKISGFREMAQNKLHVPMDRVYIIFCTERNIQLFELCSYNLIHNFAVPDIVW